MNANKLTISPSWGRLVFNAAELRPEGASTRWPKCDLGLVEGCFRERGAICHAAKFATREEAIAYVQSAPSLQGVRLSDRRLCFKYPAARELRGKPPEERAAMIEEIINNAI